MTARERVQAVMAGQVPDRLPYSFWYHFRTESWFPPALHAEFRAPASPELLQTYVEGMVRAEYEFWRRYEPDILKVMHDIPYETPDGMHCVHTPEDWARLPRLDPDTGHFGAQLEVLRQLRERVPESTPIVETLFNAFYYANKISHKRLLEHLEQEPEAVEAGLQTLQANLLDYARAVLGVCDGIYYAVNGISIDTAPREVYARYFLPLDRAMLEALASAPLVILHLHGYGELYADLLADAPCSIVCWSDRGCTLSLAEGKRLFGKAVMGGIDELNLAQMSREQVFQQAHEAFDSLGQAPFILAPGCAVPTNISPQLLGAIREFAERTRFRLA